MSNPYQSLPANAFWKFAVERSDPANQIDLFVNKWPIHKTDKIVAVGSCFAQHISRRLRLSGFSVLDGEVPRNELTELDKERYAYGIYSARYGNIYTVEQCLQLFQESLGLRRPSEVVWEKDGRFFDALRPSVSPDGYDSKADVLHERKHHLSCVSQLIKDLDVFIFTLGLTEAWRIRECGTVLPTAPGVVAGQFDDEKYEFVNFRYPEVMSSLRSLISLINDVRGSQKPSLKVLLTVSPVPLTATATKNSALVATNYSKSVLRAVAGDLAQDDPCIDYFPSFEIITNPAARTEFFESNFRSVTSAGVEAAMNTFFTRFNESYESKHTPLKTDDEAAFDPDCEDALLAEFEPEIKASSPSEIEKIASPNDDIDRLFFVGSSHLASVKKSANRNRRLSDYEKHFAPSQWMSVPWDDLRKNDALTEINFKKKYINRTPSFEIEQPHKTVLCIVGNGMLGDGIIRAHGSLMAGTPGITDGRSISPNMPIVDRVSDRLVDFYLNKFKPVISIASKINQKAKFHKIFWIASPDMCESAARFRLGSDYVDSGSHIIHKQAAEAAIDMGIAPCHRITLICHSSEKFNAGNGFSLDRYRANDRPYDIHTNADFYDDSITKMINFFGDR